MAKNYSSIGRMCHALRGRHGRRVLQRERQLHRPFGRPGNVFERRQKRATPLPAMPANVKPPKELRLGLGLQLVGGRASLCRRTRLKLTTNDPQEIIADTSCIEGEPRRCSVIVDATVCSCALLTSYLRGASDSGWDTTP